MPLDAWGNEVTITTDYINYRNRSIDKFIINELKVKGKRVFINYYKENKDYPKMCIICKNIDEAKEMYEYILDNRNPDNANNEEILYDY